MEFGMIAVLIIGFFLGLKHSLEPDHIIAVSTIAAQSRSLRKSSLAGVFWGIGHTATLFTVGFFFIVLKIELSPTWALSLEFLVGIMLVYLGIVTFMNLKRKKIHHHEHHHDGYSHNHFHVTHQHEHKEMSHLKSAMIGMVHGLAGSGAMVLLAMATVHSLREALLYIIIFGAGTVVGMMLFTTMIGLPFVMSAKNLKLNNRLIKFTALISMVFGLYYMYDLGFNEKLFMHWFH